MKINVEFTNLKNAYLKINGEKVVMRLPSFLSDDESEKLTEMFMDIALNIQTKRFPIKICYKPGKKFIFVNAKLGETYKTIFTVNTEKWK